MYRVEIVVEEMENGHGKLLVYKKDGFRTETEYPDMQEAIDEAYKTFGRERIKWRY